MAARRGARRSGSAGSGRTPDGLGPHGCLSIAGRPHAPVALQALRPGDIGFQYKQTGRNRVQSLIHLGESWLNFRTGNRAGSSDILHAFLVVGVDAPGQALITADAANNDPGASGIIGRMDFSLRRRDRNLDPQAAYVFYRFDDPRVGEMMVQIGRHWSQGPYNNFSNWHAIRSMFQVADMWRATAVRRLLFLAERANLKHALPSPWGRGYYAMMCSEYVASIGAAAVVALYRADHHIATPMSVACLQGLCAGRAGNVFAANPGAMAPSSLHARLVASPRTHTVGYVPPRFGGGLRASGRASSAPPGLTGVAQVATLPAHAPRAACSRLPQPRNASGCL